MGKERQIRFLHQHQRADGLTAYHWKPSPRLRKLGWQNVALGTDRRVAIDRAEDLNEKVDASDRDQGHAGPVARPLPRIIRMPELIRDYQASKAFTSLKPATRAEYASRLRSVETWAGNLPVLSISHQHVIDFREVLSEGSPYRAAGILRVLRLLMSWAKGKGVIATNPAEKIRIPEPPSRAHRLYRDDLVWLTTAAHDKDLPHIEIGTVLGFYTMQREGDLLAITRFTLKPIHDLSPQVRAALGGTDGRVMAMWLTQEKTTEQVSIPLAPAARTAIEKVLVEATGHAGTRKATHLIQHARHVGEVPEWRFQRDFRVARESAVANLAHVAWAKRLTNPDRAAELVRIGKRLRRCQFRDLRRSGMCWMRDLGVPVPLIASISGHSIEQTQKILDVYLPRDPVAAAEGMAMAVARQRDRDAESDGETQWA